MRAATAVAVAVVSTLGCDRGVSPESRRAFDYLLHLEQLDSAHVGAVGALARGALAFRIVLERPDARERFEQLVDQAPLAGRLVGLCGLKLTHSPRYATAAATLRKAGGEIDGMQGCLLGPPRPASGALDAIESGHFCEEYQGADEPEAIRAEYRKGGF